MLRESPRLPHPINWDEQERIFRRLPDHLARLALFAVNTGLRDANLCGLRWSWEVPIAELGRSVFVVPVEAFKSRRAHVTAFSSFTDGLDPNQRSREHFVTNIDIANDRRWVPYADGVWFQRCHFNCTSGGFRVALKGLPGAALGTHYHVGTVRGYTMRGHWRYLEHDWVAKPGTFIYEPAGEAHTLVITEDSPEPALIMFVVEGALIYLDEPTNGGLAAYEDGFTALELCRKYYREAGLDVRELDLLIR